MTLTTERTMTERLSELLRPSLSGGATLARAPYSVTMGFLTAFFGGFFAAVAVIAVNSARLRRLRRDLPIVLSALAAYLALLFVLVATGWGAGLDGNMNKPAGVLVRAVSLATFGIGYVMHRTEQRAADLMGLDRPGPWLVGIGCGLGGIGMQILATHVVVATHVFTVKNVIDKLL